MSKTFEQAADIAEYGREVLGMEKGKVSPTVAAH